MTFLYVTVSTLNPTVGIVVTLWFNLSLYKMAEAEEGTWSILGTTTRKTERGERITRFASGVESEHEDAHLLVAKEFACGSIRIYASDARMT